LLISESSLEFLAPGWIKIPSFLQKRGWKDWTSSTDTPLAVGWNQPGGATVFELLAISPFNNAFNAYMSTFNEGHADWLDLYPVKERLAGAKTEEDAVMFVDVGGGLGHQASAFKKRFPDLPGRYIVQDLAHALPSTRPEGIEYMEHDFTTEQPIKGARFYYLRYVPHDWSQEFNIHLCTQICKAMTPGYSRLIVNEWIVPEVGASMFMTAMDFNMLNANGGMERTEALHREYLEKAGLQVTGVYRPDDDVSEGVIEAEVA
jgi:demethylsterigmatocystin 6-O-methyltransferase